MSNILFQDLVVEMSETIDRVVGIIDDTNTIISCSDLSKIDTTADIDFQELFVSDDILVHNGYTYKGFYTQQSVNYVVFVEGTDATASQYTSLLAISFSSIKRFYDETHDRANFIKNIIMDNILPGDIYLKARELRFNTETTRVVLLIRILRNNDVSVYEILRNIFPEKNKDFVININETDIALVKEINEDIEDKDLFTTRYNEQD